MLTREEIINELTGLQDYFYDKVLDADMVDDASKKNAYQDVYDEILDLLLKANATANCD